MRLSGEIITGAEAPGPVSLLRPNRSWIYPLEHWRLHRLCMLKQRSCDTA